MKTRIISGLLGFILLVLVVIKGGIILDVSILIITLIALKEYHNAVKHINKLKSILIINYGLSISIFILTLINKLEIISLVIFAYVLLLLLLFVFNKDMDIESIGITMLGGLYIPFFMYHISFLKDSVYIWLVFITAWATDTFAYFIGTKLGKTKIFPNLSPKKSLEGAIGGVVGSIFITLIFAFYIGEEAYLKLTILSVICSILSQIGDLTASRIKRLAGIKDYGNIMPGHGGLLDRFDSILFTAPVVYYYVAYFL